jgi:hypothetical protein
MYVFKLFSKTYTNLDTSFIQRWPLHCLQKRMSLQYNLTCSDSASDTRQRERFKTREINMTDRLHMQRYPLQFHIPFLFFFGLLCCSLFFDQVWPQPISNLFSRLTIVTTLKSSMELCVPLVSATCVKQRQHVSSKN